MLQPLFSSVSSGVRRCKHALYMAFLWILLLQSYTYVKSHKNIYFIKVFFGKRKEEGNYHYGLFNRYIDFHFINGCSFFTSITIIWVFIVCFIMINGKRFGSFVNEVQTVKIFRGESFKCTCLQKILWFLTLKIETKRC